MRRAFLLAIGILATCEGGFRVAAHPHGDVRTYVSGLNDPRGLKFGPDGQLYVAEAGTGGGALSTVGLCDQVAPPVGPYLGGASGRIVRIRRGRVSIVVDGLPSSEASQLIGGDRSGASDVAVMDGHVLALVSGAGCCHGHADANNGLVSIERRDMTMVADLSRWLLAHPGAKGAQQPRDPDYEPDGTWYSMAVRDHRLYAVEPNHGLLVEIDPLRGHVRFAQDLFATLGDHTYTALAFDRDDLYIGTLGRIAFVPNVFPPMSDLALRPAGAVCDRPQGCPRSRVRRPTSSIRAPVADLFAGDRQSRAGRSIRPSRDDPRRPDVSLGDHPWARCGILRLRVRVSLRARARSGIASRRRVIRVIVR
jgi:hypothetical protein